jgi:two-component system OmpR family response regulator/two-component system alkaline phosphatase synthesis response regulator PhoP
MRQEGGPRVRPRLLLVEDDEAVREVVAWKFEAEGFEVVATGSGAEGLRHIDAHKPDLILLDIGLPDVDGVSVCQEARRKTQAPIIILTGEASPLVAVRALDLGATDYVRKPVDLAELAARARAALRAQAVPEPQQTCGRWGPLLIDEANGVARYGDADLGASATEIRLLVFLAARPGRAFSKQQLLDSVWHDERDPHLIEVHVSNLRRKLARAGCTRPVIATVAGRGYRFDPPPDADSRP